LSHAEPYPLKPPQKPKLCPYPPPQAESIITITTTTAEPATTQAEVATTTTTQVTTIEHVAPVHAARRLYEQHSQLLHNIAAQLWPLHSEYNWLWHWENGTSYVQTRPFPWELAVYGIRNQAFDTLDPALRQSLMQLPDTVSRMVMLRSSFPPDYTESGYSYWYYTIYFQIDSAEPAEFGHAVFYSPENSYGPFHLFNQRFPQPGQAFSANLGDNWYIV